jgi:hypothetical protein
VQPRDLVAQWNAGQGAMLYSKMEPATLHYTKNIICHVCGSAEISFAIPSGSEPTCLFRYCSDCASTNIFAHAADSVAPCRTQRTCRTFLGQTSCRLNVRMRHARGLASSLAHHLSTHFRRKWHDAEFVWIASGLRGRLGGIAERGPIHATAATRVFVHLVRRGLVHRH